MTARATIWGRDRSRGPLRGDTLPLLPKLPAQSLQAGGPSLEVRKLPLPVLDKAFLFAVALAVGLIVVSVSLLVLKGV